MMHRYIHNPLTEHLSGDLCSVVASFAYSSQEALIEFGWKSARYVFHLEQETFQSLTSAYELLGEITRLYYQTSSKNESNDLFDAFKWLIEDIIQLHVNLKLSYFSRSFEFVIQSCSSICNTNDDAKIFRYLKLFRYLVSLQKRETRVQIRFGVNDLHLALSKGLWFLAQEILLAQEKNMSTINQTKLILRKSSFILAIQSDCVKTTNWIFEQIGLTKACKALREHYITKLHHFTKIICSFAMYSWLNNTIMSKWPSEFYSVHVRSMICEWELVNKGDSKDFPLVLSVCLNPCKHDYDFTNSYDHYLSLISYLSKVNAKELRSNWTWTRAYGWNIHLWYALATENSKLVKSLLSDVTNYSMDILLAYRLVAKKGNLKMFQIMHWTVMRLDMNSTKEVKNYVEEVKTICVDICHNGHVQLLEYLFSNCIFLSSYSILSHMMQIAVESQHSEILNLCLTKMEQLKISIQNKKTLKLLLKSCLFNNNIKLLKLLIYRLRYPISGAKPLGAGTAGPGRAVGPMSEARGEAKERSDYVLSKCLNKSISSLRLNTLVWLWFNGFENVIKIMDLSALIRKEDVSIMKFLINMFGHSELNNIRKMRSGSWFNIDMVNYLVCNQFVEFDNVDSISWNTSCKSYQFGFCKHNADSDLTQWIYAHSYDKYILFENIKKNHNKCRYRKKSNSCYLSHLFQ